MKTVNHNIFKYIFVVVIIGLIIGSVYILYYKNKGEVIADEENIVSNETVQEITVVENMKMGISGFDTMNPLTTRNKEIVNLDKLIFEPLVNVTSDYKTELCLAKSIDKVSDTQYKITVDTKTKWQDGSSFFSKDIEFTINTLKSINSIYSSNVAFIQSVETPDSETAIINLTQPIYFLEYYLDFPIVSSSSYANDDFVNSSKIPIGTGMYKIASIDNDNILLIRNDRWREIKTKTPKTQSITVHKYNAIGETFNTFKLGNIDVINTYMTNYSEYVGTMGYNKKEYKGRDYNFISINCADSITSDKSVRQAIRLAINNDVISSSLFGNTVISSSSPLDYGSYLYNDSKELKFNQEQARKVLADNGWVFANDRWQKSIDGYVRKLTLSIVINQDNPTSLNVANNIKEQLAQVGINLNIAKVGRDRYVQYLNEKNYQLILTGVTNSVSPDLSYFYGDNNIANYNNPNVKNNLFNLDKIPEIQNIINDDCPYIGLYRNKGTVILNANVGGNFSPNSHFTYYNFNEWYRQQ